MELQDNESRWLMLPSPERRIVRQREPTILSLTEAVNWIRKQRPMLWLGSVMSVPSGLPSGAAVTESVLEAVFPQVAEFPDLLRQPLFSTLAPRWPLEALFDEFRSLDFDISSSFLELFAELSRATEPNALHLAVSRYYARGLSSVPVCVTTNWDNLLERAFGSEGLNVRTAGPNQQDVYRLSNKPNEKDMIIYHPHGSFDGRDVVCSFQRESRQLDLSDEFINRPTLFLRYSGYEPSLYSRLEHSAGQLWCVRSVSDFDIPAKRRLINRPNTFAYVGDVCDLLAALDVLDEPIDTSSNRVSPPELPQRLVAVVAEGLLASSDVNVCVEALSKLLPEINVLPPYDRAQFGRLTMLTKAIINHIRDRNDHELIPMTITSLAEKFNADGLKVGVLAYELRRKTTPDPRRLEQLLAVSERKPSGEAAELLESITYHPQAQLRELYKTFVRRDPRVEKRTMMAQYGALMLGDMCAVGECLEIAAFELLRDGSDTVASSVFDSAATAYYLRGLWNAGYLNELAAQNVSYLREIASNGSMMIPKNSRHP